MKRRHIVGCQVLRCLVIGCLVDYRKACRICVEENFAALGVVEEGTLARKPIKCLTS